MSFSNQNTFIEYPADGLTDTFAINFHILENSDDITATVYDITDPFDPQIVVIPYSIDHTNYPASEVVFTTEPTAGYLVHISRATPSGQYSNFAKGSFPAEAIEETFDSLAMVSQEIQTVLGRTLQNPIGGTPVTIEEIQAAASIAGEAEARLDQHDIDIQTNQAGIATNDSAIGANTAAISSISADTATNTAAIATEVSRNDNQDIAILAAQGTADSAQNNLDSYKWSVTVISATGAQGISDRELVVVKADNVTLNLPAPSSGLEVKVKMDALRVNCIVQSVAGIDGFGTSYTLSSSYESISLVSDGTQWYII